MRFYSEICVIFDLYFKKMVYFPLMPCYNAYNNQTGRKACRPGSGVLYGKTADITGYLRREQHCSGVNQQAHMA